MYRVLRSIRPRSGKKLPKVGTATRLPRRLVPSQRCTALVGPRRSQQALQVMGGLAWLDLGVNLVLSVIDKKRRGHQRAQIYLPTGRCGGLDVEMFLQLITWQGQPGTSQVPRCDAINDLKALCF